MQNLDVDEEDVARMAQIGRGNKDDIIGTLTRSLIIRNRLVDVDCKPLDFLRYVTQFVRLGFI